MAWGKKNKTQQASRQWNSGCWQRLWIRFWS